MGKPRSDCGQAGRSNFFRLSLQLGARWLFHVVSLLVSALYPTPNCGLERTSRFRRWHRPSKDFFREVVSGVWRFFFSVRATIVASLVGQQRDVQCSKVHLLAKKS